MAPSNSQHIAVDDLSADGKTPSRGGRREQAHGDDKGMRCHADMVKRPQQPARIASTAAKPPIAEAEGSSASASCG
jgi:hypothetical protein